MNLRFVVFLVFLLNFVLVLIGVASIPSSVAEEMTLVLVNSVVTSLALVLLSYWVWHDEEKLAERELAAWKERKAASVGASVTFSIAHVKVTNGERQYGNFTSQTEGTRERMITNIVSEAQKLSKDEFLEITCTSNVADEMKGVLRDRLGNDYKVSFGFPSERGSVLYVERLQLT